jgi:hypothetical protein
MLAGGPSGAGGPGGAGGSMAAALATTSGFEGREAALGQAVALAIRTLKDNIPYQHEMNDALVKMHLNSVQFAKNQGLSKQYVEHDVKAMQPMLQRMKGMIEKSGEKEIALVAIFERTACLYHLHLPVHPRARDFAPHRPVRSHRSRTTRFMAQTSTARLWRIDGRTARSVGHRIRR